MTAAQRKVLSTIGLVLVFAVFGCKPRQDMGGSRVLAGGGGGGAGDCSWADKKEPKNVEEAMTELKKELFLLSSAAEETTPKLEQARAKLLLTARAEGVPGDKYVADCACVEPPEKEIAFANEKTDALKMTAGLAERVAKVNEFGGGEAATEAVVSIGQMAVRLGSEGQSELALTVTNEIHKAVMTLEASSGVEMAVPDILTAGLALEVSEATESGGKEQTVKVMEYAQRMFSAKDTSSSGYFQDIAGKTGTKTALKEFTQRVEPQRRFEEVRKLVAEGKIFEEVGKVHKSFRTPEQTRRLMEVAKKAPRVRLLKGPVP